MLAGGVVVAPGLLAACERTGTNGTAGEGGRLEELRSQGTIQVGIAGEEPYGYLDGGELTGMDPTVQQEIWGNLGVDEVQATQVDFDGLIPGLNAGRFDVVAAGMFITPERCAEAAFSDPMYCAPNAFLVAPGNPLNISDFQSIAEADAKLVVLGGAVEGQYAQEAGVAGGNITRVGSPRDGLLQLEQGRVDAFGLTTITLNDILDKNPDADVELTEAFTPTLEGEEQLGCGAAVFRQEDTELVDAFNEELASLRESGRLQEIIEPFGFGPETQEGIEDITTEQLCGTG